MSMLRAPTEELIPGSGLPGSGPKSQQGHELPLDGDEVTQLRTGEMCIPQVVMALDVFIPQPRPLAPGD